MHKLFISHSTEDDAIVRRLQQALEGAGLTVWIDSRELTGGDLLWPEVERQIRAADAFLVLVSPAGLQSRWVGKELKLALTVQQERGAAAYRVIPLSLDGTDLGVMEQFFADEPAYIPLGSAPDGIGEALPRILAALGLERPADLESTRQPAAQPIEDLILELTDLGFHEDENHVRRAQARARLIYDPADSAARGASSAKSWRLIAPLGPIESEELTWYLERYAVWPGKPFQARAQQVETDLVRWGRLLFEAALPGEHTARVIAAWDKAGASPAGDAARRFSIQVDAAVLAGSSHDEQQLAQEAATALLALPWELLHDGRGFLFQGARPTRVRRRLPSADGYDRPLIAPPIRILLVSPRPEDDACGYIDHRVSAIPLVEAVERLGGLVELTILRPPTLPALREALDRARAAKQPFHVVHFDGHGVYDRRKGLGGLCFEEPGDRDTLDKRRHKTVYTDEIGPLLQDHRIPLIFLEACQSAQAADATESVAAALLKVGVAGVVAMTHSVLVETARRFVRPFYGALAEGLRIGDAMLRAQRALFDDDARGQVFGAGQLRLKDWFVPVLYQEQSDPRLFERLPAPRTVEQTERDLKARLGALPEPPEPGFVGRSRDLLALERLLLAERWALIRGQGGEGKTALAVELARWRVRSGQCQRAAFVSVEVYSTPEAVIDALGRQLVPSYSVGGFKDLDQALQPIERALRELPTTLVLDNLESLLPRGLDPEAPGLLAEETADSLAAILALAARLYPIGETRLLLTSREPLAHTGATPFATARNRRELHRLGPEDAVKLVERALNESGSGLPDAETQAIERLVESVHGHARTLALLAPSLREIGIDATRERLVALMERMEREHPNDRERSLYASVELSLQRLDSEQRERVRVLGVFQGSVDLDLLRHMMDWDEATVADLAQALIDTGLATAGPYNHLALTPALCPYLLRGLDGAEREALAARWQAAMGQYVGFLVQQHSRNSELSATLTRLELANLLALLDRVESAADPEATIGLATSLHQLFQWLGRPRLQTRLARARDAAEAALGDGWGHAAFEARRTRIEQQLAAGQPQAAFDGARALLERTLKAGDAAYAGAGYDLALAHFLIARVLKTAGDAEQALGLLERARAGFEAIARAESNRAAEAMASICLAERGDCLRDLGRLDEAGSAYEESIRRAEVLDHARQVAAAKGNLGTVRLYQGRIDEALAAYSEARERFEALGEPGSVAAIWHQTGVAHQEAGQAEAAEDAYRQSLAIDVRLGDRAGQASTLGQLGVLYTDLLDRPEEAVAFYRQAGERYVEIGDLAGEGRQRNNLALTLRRLARPDEARREIDRAIECRAGLGHAAQPWTTWSILSDIETDTGHPEAAREARAKAVAAYLAYRRDGGENHWLSGQLALAIGERLLAGRSADAEAQLRERANDPELPEPLRPFVAALLALAQGRRDPALADRPGLTYDMSAEILLLIERLARSATPPPNPRPS